ncbi:penicillin-binding protein 1C [Roseibaca sp. Y0-43]|uniref:penicillin-binding protein 1C n=1 Tax=Roseibaca sp. Y0-43 TaxID=2816854 RepID=UPI001D0C7B15|nr:penicillin-binding protein 1C [Roseibaca sp. Y0-43]MCC1481887.1 penicillin-binding protein 1C [Roseibaca sp. Y0-43]
MRWVLGLVAASAVAGWLALEAWVDATDLPPLTPETGAEVLAEDGTLLRAYTVADGRWRLAVDPARVDQTYLALLLAYEDRRFHTHPGVDPVAMVRAFWQSARAGRMVSGGSTLTMQVARLLEDGPTGTWAGKARQIRVALALERQLHKDAILSLYLHLAPMGGNLEGLRAGSFAWFGKDPARLTPAQAALLVALPQSPARRSPDRDAAAARMARDRVLDRAVTARVLTRAEAEAAKREAIPTARRPFPALAPHLADRLVAALPAQKLHRTTLNASLQTALEELARDTLRDLPPRAGLALVVADAQTGRIRAHIGGAYGDDARGGFNDMTRAMRSPGSALKPLVYGLAFSDGLAHPETLVNDRPASFGGYAPQNFDGRFRGPVTVREALQLSLNLPVVEMTNSLGPARLMSALRSAGVDTALDGQPGLAVALGGVGVSLEGLVQLYAGIARRGEAVTLTTAPGPVAQGAQVIRPEAAWHLGQILARAPRPAHLPGWPLAFKTGTSYGHRDAWAVGFDGQHVAGVWIGRADGTPLPGTFGLDAAAPVLFETFARLGPRPAPLPPAPPGTLDVAHVDLPPPLRRFGPQLATDADAPQLAFPPAGAALRPVAGRVMARVDRGRAPFTWFANGAPVLTRSFEREAHLPVTGPGYVTLSVVDATGRAARVELELR